MVGNETAGTTLFQEHEFCSSPVPLKYSGRRMAESFVNVREPCTEFMPYLHCIVHACVDASEEKKHDLLILLICLNTPCSSWNAWPIGLLQYDK